MTAAIAARPGPPTLRFRGQAYPVLLPRLSDPRLHLAAVIVSLQVLGQVGLGFRVSIAQILVALGTCAVLEIGITFRDKRVIMWPASALITANGVAFVLRVPGTEHGDWWSLRGAWIFAAAAALGLLSKHVIRLGGRHVFNPSNLGLVVAFLVLGSDRAEPLDFWWGHMTPWLGLALAIIVSGGVIILRRLKLLPIAIAFWLTFAAAIGVLALSGHSMTASWHLGPITGAHFWWTLVASPEILVFLFFMITDPKTIPGSPGGRVPYAMAVALLAAVLIAPQRQEFGTKVALLGALALVCLAMPLLARMPRPGLRLSRAALLAPALAAYGAVLVLAGGPARAVAGGPVPAPVQVPASGGPAISIVAAPDVASTITFGEARRMTHDVVASLGIQSAALQARDAAQAAGGADGPWLLAIEQRIGAAGRDGRLAVPRYDITSVRYTLARRPHQMMPAILATLRGTESVRTFAGRREVAARGPAPYVHTFEIAPGPVRYRLVTDELPPGWHQ